MRPEHDRLLDILEAPERILEDTRGLNEASFVKARVVRQAVERNLEIIGEAAKNLSGETISRMPGIDWRGLCGVRECHQRAVDEAVQTATMGCVPQRLDIEGRIHAHQPRRRFRRRRSRRPHLSAGGNRRGHGLHGRPRRGVVPPRHASLARGALGL